MKLFWLTIFFMILWLGCTEEFVRTFVHSGDLIYLVLNFAGMILFFFVFLMVLVIDRDHQKKLKHDSILIKPMKEVKPSNDPWAVNQLTAEPKQKDQFALTKKLED